MRKSVSVVGYDILHVKNAGYVGGYLRQTFHNVSPSKSQLVGSSHAIVFSVICTVKKRIGVGVLAIQNSVKGDANLKTVFGVSL
jgi:hypothetical protein